MPSWSFIALMSNQVREAMTFAKLKPLCNLRKIQRSKHPEAKYSPLSGEAA